MKRIMILGLILSLVLLSGCYQINVNTDNTTLVKENMIKACESELCDFRVRENDKYIKVFCDCGNEFIIEEYNKHTKRLKIK